MIEVESMANQGPISHPGAWSFPDCSELGTPGMGTLTWEESKSVLALFAVTSSPILLGNDPRPHMMQQRLVELYLNKDMLAINQQYAQGHAGGRVLTRPGEHEVSPFSNSTAGLCSNCVQFHWTPSPSSFVTWSLFPIRPFLFWWFALTRLVLLP